MKNPVLKSFIVFAGFLAFFICLFPDVVFYGTSFAKRDMLRYYYPVWHFGTECLKQGIVPLWNPYNSYGTPFLADIQTCVFYPPTILFYLGSFLWGFNFYILLHLALAGYFTFLWMKECGASWEASLVSGVAFCIGGYVLSAINLTISLCTLIYFPLLLLCLRKSFRSSSLVWKASAGGVLLLQYLAGDPAVFFGSLVISSFFTFYKTAEESCRRRMLHLPHALTSLQVVGIFLGLGAFHYLLFFEFLQHSQRGTPSFDTMTMWSMQYNDLISFFFPFFSDISLFFMDYWVRQSWLENSYAGITVMMLAVYSFREVRKKPIVGYHLLLALFGVALALGRFSALYAVLYDYFPFFKFIRYPARFLYLFSFAVACLAGFGVDRLMRRAEAPDKRPLSHVVATTMAGCILFVVFAVMASMYFAPDLEEKAVRWVVDSFGLFTGKSWAVEDAKDLALPVLTNFKRTTVLFALMLLAYLTIRHFKPRRALAALFLGLLIFGDLAETNLVEMRVDGAWMERTGSNIQTLMKDKSVFRVQASPRASQIQFEPPMGPSLESTLMVLKEILAPNFLLPLRISYIAGYDSIFLKEAIAINSRGRAIQDPREYRYLDMLNLKYTVSPKEEIGEPYHLINKAYPVNLFENTRALPRAFLVATHRVEPNREKILSSIVSTDFDPMAGVYLEKEPPPFSNNTVSPASDTAEIPSYGPNEVRIRVDSSRDQWLFLSDMFYPGWRVFVNGREAEPFRANFSFRAVQVPSGASEVRWVYDPLLYKIGLAVTALTVILLSFLYFLERRRCRL